MNKFKKTIIIISSVLLWIAFAFIVRSCFPKKEIVYQTIKSDSTIAIRYITETKHDTIPTFFSKIKWKYTDPVEIREQKVDTVFRDIVRKQNVMLKLEKKGNFLRIVAFNDEQEILKEFEFEVGRDFVVNSGTSTIFVKSKKFTFDGFYVGAGVRTNLPINTSNKALNEVKNNLDYKVILGTGITYLNNISVDFSTSYLFKSQDIQADLSLKYYFK